MEIILKKNKCKLKATVGIRYKILNSILELDNIIINEIFGVDNTTYKILEINKDNIIIQEVKSNE
ncbi:MAG: hypothetical protein ACRDB0_04980 [Paraclostridium sp.]